jgi:hypothetical protein
MTRRATTRAAVLAAIFVAEVDARVAARLVMVRRRPAKITPEAPAACALTPEPT